MIDLGYVALGVDVETCRPYINRAEQLARRSGRPRTLGSAFRVDAQLALRERNFVRTEDAAMEAIRCFKLIGLHNDVARSYIVHGQAAFDNLMNRGDLQEACRRLRQGLAAAELGRGMSASEVVRADLHAMLGELEMKDGNIEQFRQHCLEAIDLYWQIDAYSDICHISENLAMILSRAGQQRAALDCCLGALQYTKANDLRSTWLGEAAMM